MRSFTLASLACASFALMAVDDAAAHGGVYRGPGDIVPPHSGPGPGGTGGPRGPSTGTPRGPNTPGGPALPGTHGPGTGNNRGPGAGPPGGPRTPTGIDVGDDLSAWEFWWEINKDPFINLKTAIHADQPATGGDMFWLGAGMSRIGRDTLQPTDDQIVNEILPALDRALTGVPQRDVTSSCLVAMAKIGRNTPGFDLLATLRTSLREHDQEIRETAALSLGITQMPEALPDLVALVDDTPRGRELVDRRSVDERTRAFAAYGLGLIGWANEDPEVDARALESLRTALLDDDSAGWNLRVAAVNAIGLLRPDPSTAHGARLLGSCFDVLQDYWSRDVGVGEQLVQAHVPPAIAKLAHMVDLAVNPNLSARLAEIRRDWLDQLSDRNPSRRTNVTVAQSVIVALGRTTGPNRRTGTTSAFDREVSASLLSTFHRARDHQSRYFALMALGQIGGVVNRDALLEVLRTGIKALERPWAALSLGVLEFRRRQAAGPDAAVDRLVGERLLAQLDLQKNTRTLAAIAIGLGLSGHVDAADRLRDLLEDRRHQDELAGYLCISLALLEDERSFDLVRRVVETSVRRPVLLRQAAIALGKLGDREAALLLVRLLGEPGQQNLAKLSAIASALGAIGDKRSISPVVRVLDDAGLPALSRAFAAAALGGIADKELLPWSSKIGANMNYRAAVETLTNRVNGILDIL